MTASTSHENSATANELENLVSDVKGMLSNKELDAMPQIKALRKRVDESLTAVRETAVETAHEAARKARQAAATANEYAHDEPWQVAGGALAVGILLGFLLGRR